MEDVSVGPSDMYKPSRKKKDAYEVQNEPKKKVPLKANKTISGASATIYAKRRKLRKMLILDEVIEKEEEPLINKMKIA